MADDYDFEAPPSADEWLALDEEERVARIEAAHRRTGAPVGQAAGVHASIHATVENRLASGAPFVLAAYDRCRAAGLDRHTTIHALASVVTRHIMAILQREPSFDQATADRDFAAIDPARWQRRPR